MRYEGAMPTTPPATLGPEFPLVSESSCPPRPAQNFKDAIPLKILLFSGAVKTPSVSDTTDGEDRTKCAVRAACPPQNIVDCPNRTRTRHRERERESRSRRRSAAEVVFAAEYDETATDD